MKKILGVFGMLSVLGLWPALGFAQGGDVKAKLKAMKPKDYPAQQIEFGVAFPAGGWMDVTAPIANYVKYGANFAFVILSYGVRGESNDLWNVEGQTTDNEKKKKPAE